MDAQTVGTIGGQGRVGYSLAAGAAFAEFAAVPKTNVERAPDDLPIHEEVAFLVIFPTAYVGLRERSPPEARRNRPRPRRSRRSWFGGYPASTALGAGVIAAASGAVKMGIGRELGAEEAIDQTEPIVERVRELTRGNGVDVVMDPVGGEVAEDRLRCLTWDARLVIVGFAGGTIADLLSNRLLLKHAAAMGAYWGEYRRHHPEPVAVRVGRGAIALFSKLLRHPHAGKRAATVFIELHCSSKVFRPISVPARLRAP